jgi:hypothetical protein
VCFYLGGEQREEAIVPPPAEPLKDTDPRFENEDGTINKRAFVAYMQDYLKARKEWQERRSVEVITPTPFHFAVSGLLQQLAEEAWVMMDFHLTPDGIPWNKLPWWKWRIWKCFWQGESAGRRLSR